MSGEQSKKYFHVAFRVLIVKVSLLLTSSGCSMSELESSFDYVHPDKINRERGALAMMAYELGDDTPQDCSAVTDINHATPLSNSVVRSDIVCYKFTAPADSTYVINLTTIAGDADLFIGELNCIPDGQDYDPSPDRDRYCDWDRDSENLGLQPDEITVNLTAGSFIGIGVYGWKDSDYTLTVN